MSNAYMERRVAQIYLDLAHFAYKINRRFDAIITEINKLQSEIDKINNLMNSKDVSIICDMQVERPIGD